jgi:hypothetical protein
MGGTARAAIAAALVGALLHGTAAAAEPTAPATWKKQEVKLVYQGLTTKYSCEGLKQKVRNLLRYFGARSEGIKLRAYGCAGGPYRPSPVVNLQMEFEALQPAAAGGKGTVPARWVERNLFAETKVSRDAPSYIERGDCELVQKFVAVVLPSFAHETLSDLTRCIPHELDGTMPNLRVRVLVPDDDQKR